jgi:predicted dehydrogenase
LTLRGALLGCGNIAQLGHLPAYGAISPDGERCQVVAAADLEPENLGRVQQLVPGIRIYGQVQELLDEVRPDFVDICAPPNAPDELIEQAIAAGCHILCEKPLSSTVEGAIALGAAIRASKLVYMPGHHYHFAPAWQSIRAAIDQGAIGVPAFGSIRIERLRANDGNAHWNPVWRTSEAYSGGGILMDHGSHLFYQLRGLFGDPVSITARIETRRHWDYEVEDTACCYLDFGNTVIRASLTWAATQRRTAHRYLGSTGRIDCDEDAVTLTSRDNSEILFAGGGFSADSSHSTWYTPLISDFLGRIERTDLDRRPLEEAVATMRCISAAYQSAATGKTVQMSGDDPDALLMAQALP